MTLSLLCGQNKTMLELLSSCIKQHTASGDYGFAIVKKTKAAQPAMCGKAMTLDQYVKSAISVNTVTNIVAINVVEVSCEDLACANSLPCSTSNESFEELMAQTFVFTTDGEWAIYLFNIT